MHEPNSLFGVPEVNKKVPDRWKCRNVGDGEASFLHLSTQKQYFHDPLNGKYIDVS